MLGAGPEGRAEAGAAEISAKTGPYRVGAQEAFAGIRVQAFGLEEHPAVPVEKEAAHAGFLAAVDGCVGRGKQRHGVAQGLEIQRKNQNALKIARRVVNGRGKTQHIKRQALQRLVDGHHGIGYFQRLAHVDVAGFLAGTDVVEGARRGVQSHVRGHGNDFAAVIEEKIAAFRRQAHEGHFAIAQAVGPGAEFEAAHHLLPVHGAGGQDQQLVARFHQGLLQRKAHCLGLKSRVARYCTIDDVFDAAPGGEKDKRQDQGQQGQPQHQHAAGEAAIRKKKGGFHGASTGDGAKNAHTPPYLRKKAQSLGGA